MKYRETLDDAKGYLVLACGLLVLLSLTTVASAQQALITTVAGTGSTFFNGEPTPAATANLALPLGVALDNMDNLFIADASQHRIRRVDANTGIITTVAGTGIGGFNEDNIPAVNAQLTLPYDVALDNVGNLFIVDANSHRIRKVDANTGIITTVAGYGAGGFNGDNIPATNARLGQPLGIALDSVGNLFIADSSNHRIRKVDANTGIITTVAGNGNFGFNGDNIPATNAQLAQPLRMTFDGLGNLFIADTSNHRIRKVDANTGIITTVAGNGNFGFNEDNIPTVNAKLAQPWGVAFDALGNLFIGDASNHRIRKVDTNTGIITTVAGNGAFGFNGDNILATTAQLNGPAGVVFDSEGNLFIADANNHRIRKVTLSNQPPIANAGSDQLFVECLHPVGASVTLDGSGSSDPELDLLTYTWTGPFGTAMGGNPIVTFPLGGPHTVTLIVNDGTLDSAPDTVDIMVVDTIAPAIILNGENSLTLECHVDSYDEPGAGISDACDSSPTLTITDTVNSTTPGTYPITYIATDASGNTATAIRTVNVVDTTSPTITLNGENSLTLECHVDSYDEPGAGISDACDSSPTLTITGTVDSTTPGTYPITYTATDVSGNIATATRTVNVVDTTPSIITFNGENPLTLECHVDSYDEPGAGVSDACDSSPTLTITGTVDSTTPGTYPINYIATDASGNTAVVTRTVNVVDTTSPIITLNGENPLTLECHVDSYDESEAGVSDACDSSPTLTITGTVDSTALGTYPIVYTATDASGNTATATRTINVVDTTPPTITLVGDNPLTLVCPQPYNELEAEVNDTCDESPILTNIGSVDAFMPGVYPITYTATDASGNQAQAVRTVEMVLPDAFTYTMFSDLGKLELKNNAVVNGDVFSNGDADIKKDARIQNGRLIVTGEAKGKGDFTLGPLPQPLPQFPLLDTTEYDLLLADAASQPKGKLVTTDLDLAGGILLIKGDVEIKKGGSITGPGIIVSTKKIKLKENCTIGEGITFIADEKLEIKENATSSPMGENIFFSRKKIEIKKDSHIEGSLLSLGDIELKDNLTFIGVAYATHKVRIHKESSIIGSVIAYELKDVHENTTLTYDEAIVGQVFTQVFILPPAAAPIALLGQEYNVPKSILAIHGAIVNEVRHADLVLALAESDLRITVKNRSTGHTLLTLSTPASDSTGGISHLNFALPSTHTVQARNVLEITGETASAHIGVQSVHHIVSAEEIRSGQIYLPDLVVYQIPLETKLLDNYPNPFNPETWIPYRLAEAAEVTLTIYDTTGALVRKISVGLRSVAVYESKHKAIYWDGRNDAGEQVASNIYFYHLKAGGYQATKKMVILK